MSTTRSLIIRKVAKLSWILPVQEKMSQYRSLFGFTVYLRIAPRPFRCSNIKHLWTEALVAAAGWQNAPGIVIGRWTQDQNTEWQYQHYLPAATLPVKWEYSGFLWSFQGLIKWPWYSMWPDIKEPCQFQLIYTYIVDNSSCQFSSYECFKMPVKLQYFSMYPF